MLVGLVLSFSVSLAVHVAIFRAVSAKISVVNYVYPCFGCCPTPAMCQVGVASHVQEPSAWGSSLGWLESIVFLQLTRI